MEIKMDLLLTSKDNNWENILKDKISDELKDVEIGHKYFNEYVIRFYIYDNNYNKIYHETRFYIDDNCTDNNKPVLEVHSYKYIYHLTLEQIIQELHSIYNFEIYIQENECA